MRILVVQGDPRAGALLQQGFNEQGYLVDMRTLGGEAIGSCQSAEYDIVILGRHLPDIDGVELCRSMRRQGLAMPVIVLSSEDGTEPTVDALDAGADDYVAGRVEFEELLARVRAVARRGHPDEGSVLRYEGVEVDLARRTVTVGGGVVAFTPREFAVLEHLMRNRDRVVTRTSLTDQVWGEDVHPDNSNVVDVYMSRVRRKLGDKRDLIHTVHGTGYMLAAAAPAT